VNSASLAKAAQRARVSQRTVRVMPASSVGKTACTLPQRHGSVVQAGAHDKGCALSEHSMVTTMHQRRAQCSNTSQRSRTTTQPWWQCATREPQCSASVSREQEGSVWSRTLAARNGLWQRRHQKTRWACGYGIGSSTESGRPGGTSSEELHNPPKRGKGDSPVISTMRSPPYGRWAGAGCPGKALAPALSRK
jgi:hypothetical protein